MSLSPKLPLPCDAAPPMAGAAREVLRRVEEAVATVPSYCPAESAKGQALLEAVLAANTSTRAPVSSAVVAPTPSSAVASEQLLRTLGVAVAGWRDVRLTPCFVFDTETTGLGKAAILEIACVEVVIFTTITTSSTGSAVLGLLPTGRRFHRLVKPFMPIHPKAQQVHGLSAAMLQNEPPIGAVLDAFWSFCCAAPLTADAVLEARMAKLSVSNNTTSTKMMDRPPIPVHASAALMQLIEAADATTTNTNNNNSSNNNNANPLSAADKQQNKPDVHDDTFSKKEEEITPRDSQSPQSPPRLRQTRSVNGVVTTIISPTASGSSPRTPNAPAGTGTGTGTVASAAPSTPLTKASIVPPTAGGAGGDVSTPPCSAPCAAESAAATTTSSTPATLSSCRSVLWAGHNVQFDLKALDFNASEGGCGPLLGASGGAVPSLCTMSLFRALYKGRNLPYNLNACGDFFGIKKDLDAAERAAIGDFRLKDAASQHSAMTDTHATVTVLRKIIETAILALQ